MLDRSKGPRARPRLRFLDMREKILVRELRVLGRNRGPMSLRLGIAGQRASGTVLLQVRTHPLLTKKTTASSTRMKNQTGFVRLPQKLHALARNGYSSNSREDQDYADHFQEPGVSDASASAQCRAGWSTMILRKRPSCASLFLANAPTMVGLSRQNDPQTSHPLRRRQRRQEKRPAQRWRDFLRP